MNAVAKNDLLVELKESQNFFTDHLSAILV